MISSILGWIGGFSQNLMSVVLGFIANLFGALFNGLITVLKALFNPVLQLIAFVFYFIYKLAELIVVLLKVLLAIGKLLYMFVMGIFNTIKGFVWTPTPPDHGSWSGAIGQVFAALEPYQLGKIAYVMMFAIWVTTAVAAVKILSGRGGDSD